MPKVRSPKIEPTEYKRVIEENGKWVWEETGVGTNLFRIVEGEERRCGSVSMNRFSKRFDVYWHGQKEGERIAVESHREGVKLLKVKVKEFKAWRYGMLSKEERKDLKSEIDAARERLKK